MKHLVVLPEHTYAGYCSTGANKDWAACLAVEMDDQNTNPATMSEMTEVVYLSLHGPHSGNMIVDPLKKLAMKQAHVHYIEQKHTSGHLMNHVSDWYHERWASACPLCFLRMKGKTA